jgi:RNA polymerase sigma-70 factor (sigma-E family)
VSADEALSQLITDSGDRLLRLAYQLTHDRAAAEDVVQEALMKLYRAWRRDVPLPEHVDAYARRAVVNEFLRRQRLRSATELISADLPELVESSFEDVVVDRDELWRALGTLPVRQRSVLVLRYYEGLPDAQIAGLLDAKEATVRSLAARGLVALRRESSISEVRGS